MMIKKWLAILLLLLTASGYSQGRTDFHGVVNTSGAVAAGVFIINKTTGAEVKSDAKGAFTIPAKAGDQIVVYSTYTEVREFAVTAAALAANPYEMEVIPKATELKEVVITDMNPENMGLVPKGQKQYTVAERRLYTAKSGMGLDQLINVLSGRMRMLKQAVATEKKQALMDSLDSLFTDEELAGFGLPRETARGFLYYAVEDPRVADAIKDNNESLVKLLLMELSQSYLKLQKDE
ncbi:hypothetical protein ACLI09_10365 [Flavobacterium sp. RHBU_24]|uniref:hypothetical protein n=1 Tax=Flavobacterium sp. RHBU_24 TaxID=3391185 RepID=UPI003984A029